MKIKPHCSDKSLGELLSAYEMGLLSSDEQARVEKHLLDCEACQEEIYETGPLTTELHEHSEHIASLLADEIEHEARLPQSLPDRIGALLDRLLPSGGWTGAWKALVPVGVAAAVFFGIILPRLGGPDWEGLAIVEPVPYVKIQTRASGDDERMKLFDSGMSNYVSQDYRVAAKELAESYRLGDRSATGTKGSDQAAFYAGLSFLISGVPDSATVYLTQTLESPLKVLVDRSHWYLAQSCLMQSRPDCAITHLESLKESPGYKTRAGDLLERIAELR